MQGQEIEQRFDSSLDCNHTLLIDLDVYMYETEYDFAYTCSTFGSSAVVSHGGVLGLLPPCIPEFQLLLYEQSLARKRCLRKEVTAGAVKQTVARATKQAPEMSKAREARAKEAKAKVARTAMAKEAKAMVARAAHARAVMAEMAMAKEMAKEMAVMAEMAMEMGSQI